MTKNRWMGFIVHIKRRRRHRAGQQYKVQLSSDGGALQLGTRSIYFLCHSSLCFKDLDFAHKSKLWNHCNICCILRPMTEKDVGVNFIKISRTAGSTGARRQYKLQFSSCGGAWQLGRLSRSFKALRWIHPKSSMPAERSPQKTSVCQ